MNASKEILEEIPTFRGKFYDVADISRLPNKESSPSPSSLVDRFFNWWGRLITTWDINPDPDKSPKESYIAWHPTRNLLAVSKDRVVHVYDINNRTWTEQLFNTVQKNGIYCLQWCSDSDCLLVGCSTGVACWRLYYNYNKQRQTLEEKFSTFMQFFEHPSKRPVHCIDVSNQGRLFAAMTIGEGVIYVWDSTSSTHAPVYCFDGNVGQSLKWSPSGLHIAVTDRTGGLVLVDSYTWKYNSCCQIRPPVSAVCWLGELDCLFYTSGSTQIYTCELFRRQQQQQQNNSNNNNNSNHSSRRRYSSSKHRKSRDGAEHVSENIQSINVSPVPLNLDVGLLYRDLDASTIGICQMVSEDRQGNYVAISFIAWSTDENGEKIGTPLPDIALYLVRTKPMLTFTFIRKISYDPCNSSLLNYPVTFLLRAVASDSDGSAAAGFGGWVVVRNDINASSSSADMDAMDLDLDAVDCGEPSNGHSDITNHELYISVAWSNGTMSILNIQQQ